MLVILTLVDLDPKTLRSSIGVVPQQPTLFSADVTHNIGYGNPAANINQIKERCKRSLCVRVYRAAS